MPSLNDFDFQLDPERIAQRPVEPRDASKLLVFHRQASPVPASPSAPELNLEHRRFHDILDYLHPNDTLVLNRSKVIPARLFGERLPTRGKVEVFLIRALDAPTGRARWNCLTHAKASLQPGDRLGLPTAEHPAVTATLLERHGLDGDLLEFDLSPAEFNRWYPTFGHMPLPPYIRRKESADLPAAELATLEKIDHDRYQTVYAREEGSVAAPTAGLHFTAELLERLRHKGIRLTELILHVGPGTFRPVKTENLAEHPMHEEFFEIPPACVAAIAAARASGGRVVAVGTTALRALESATPPGADCPTPGGGSTRLFLYPPARFGCVNALITNFHLPKSTLLMLVAAFAAPHSTAGIAQIQATYRITIAQNYRFFSYGDAMLIT